MMQMTKIQILLIVLLTNMIGIVGCDASRTTSSTGTVAQSKQSNTASYENGTAIQVNGKVIHSATIPADFPLTLYIRRNSVDDGVHTSGPVERNHLVLATEPPPVTGKSSPIHDPEGTIDNVAYIARAKIEGRYLGDGYIDRYKEDQTVSKYTHQNWRVFSHADKSHPERWVCVTRILEWGDVVVIIGSPIVTKAQVLGVLDGVKLHQETVLPDM